MTEVSTADLAAIADVAAQLAEQADSLSAEQACELLTEARTAQRALAMAIDMLEAQALRSIEQPILIGKTVWAKKPVFKKRPDQGLIARVVAALASAPDMNGEVPTAADAAQAATERMAGLYVSPSTVPKVGGVKALGLSMDDVTSEEHTGFELKRTELE